MSSIQSSTIIPTFKQNNLISPYENENPKKRMAAPEGCKQYVSFSKTQEARFNLVKENKFLSKRFLCHLFGDSFMQDTIYEGWFTSDALIHMIKILKENEISKEITEVIEDLESCLAWELKVLSMKLATTAVDTEEVSENLFQSETDAEIEEASENELEVSDLETPQIKEELVDEMIESDIEMLSEDEEEYQDIYEVEENQSHEVENNPANITQEAINPFAEKIISELQQAIADLKVGKKILFPGGCLGHGVLYEFKCVGENDYLFAVYNTGTGSERHMGYFEDECQSKVLGIYRLHNISSEKIKDKQILTMLMNLLSTPSQEFSSSLYDVILPMFEGKPDLTPSDSSEYMQRQRSKTCVWKMLSAYCRYNLSKMDRKYIKLKSRLDVFQKWYDQGYDLDIRKVSESLLNKLIINYKFEIYKGDLAPVNFSREELLTLGIYKVKKTFNRYKMLLSEKEVEKVEVWYSKFTGQSIHEG